MHQQIEIIKFKLHQRVIYHSIAHHKISTPWNSQHPGILIFDTIIIFEKIDHVISSQKITPECTLQCKNLCNILHQQIEFIKFKLHQRVIYHSIAHHKISTP